MATFSELSEIANNAGQPELVYKLMELSTASAVWNTRKGVAFALAEQSRGRLQKHLDKLVPALYRYTFDPNPKIAAAMKQVGWAGHALANRRSSLATRRPLPTAHLSTPPPNAHNSMASVPLLRCGRRSCPSQRRRSRRT